MNKITDTDRFIKENIELIDIKFNPMHWDKLQASLSTGITDTPTSETATTKPLSIQKVILLSVSSIVVISAVIYYSFFNSKVEKPNVQEKNKIEMPVMADSLDVKLKVEDQLPLPKLKLESNDTAKKTAIDSAKLKLQTIEPADSLEDDLYLIW